MAAFVVVSMPTLMAACSTARTDPDADYTSIWTSPTHPTGARRTGCVKQPSACGYPDSTITGVAATATLRRVPEEVSSGPGWHYDTRGWVTVDGRGAVLRALEFRVPVEISAPDVTVSGCRILVTGEAWGVGLKHSINPKIVGNTISSPAQDGPQRLAVGVKDVYGDATGTQILGNDIFHTSTGVQVHEGLVEGNYIHDLGFNIGDHLNGITSNGATTPMTIRGNTVLNPRDQADAISLFEDFGPEGNRRIEGNLIAGGSYTIYAGANAGGPQPRDIVLLDNRFSRVYFPNGGAFGPIAAFDAQAPRNVASGNYWDEDLTPVTP
jgi:hypothetical protein